MLTFMSKNIKYLVALGLAGALALSSLGTALADFPAQDSRAKHGIFGTVTAKTDNSFTVRTNQGTTVQLGVTGDTQFRASGKAEASLSNLAVGSRVAILAEGTGTSISARKVMLVPGEPQREHRVLTVTEIEGKTVVAVDARGNQIRVELDLAPSADIKGQFITFIGVKSEQSNRFKANVQVKIDQVVKRVEAHTKKLETEAKVEANAQIKASKEKDLAELKARLEALMQRHLDLLAEIIAKAPEQSKASLEAALQLSLKGHKAALEALGDSRTKVEARLDLRTVQGSVEAINAQTNEITVRSHGDASLTLKISGDTRILIGEQAGSFSNLAVGDQVTVRFNAATSLAAEIRVKIEAKAQGTIQAVDTTKGQLVITLANGATLTLKLTPNTRIEVNKKASTAADLKVNASVEVEFNIKTMEAREVEASTRGEVRGTVKAVDNAAGTVTIRTEAGKDVTVKVTNATKVNIQGLLFGILGVQPGMEVKAEFDLATGEATELKVRAEAHGRGEARDQDRAHGTIASVDAAGGKITVRLDTGGTLTVRAPADATIEVNGERVALSGLEAGSRVKVEFDATTQAASEVRARLKTQAEAADRPPKLEAEAHGTIQALDAAKHKMTIRLRDGSTKELTISADTTIRINGQHSTEADLKPGMELEVRFRTDTSAALRINTTARLEAEAHGTIQALDAAKHKATIRLRDGSTKELTISGDTTIHINGKPSVEADLKPGMELEVRFQTDTASALRINATAKVEAQAEIRGRVKSVNSAANQLVVETADGKTVVVSIVNTTRFKGEKALTLPAITAGAEVKIKLQAGVSGNVAESIEVLGKSGASSDLGAGRHSQASIGHGAEATASGLLQVAIPTH